MTSRTSCLSHYCWIFTECVLQTLSSEWSYRKTEFLKVVQVGRNMTHHLCLLKTTQILVMEHLTVRIFVNNYLQ